MKFDLSRLSTLDAIVAEGSFEAASKSLHVTQSAISQRLKALENEVGRVLVQRTKPVTVTESGAALLQLARQINALADDTVDRLSGTAMSDKTPQVPIAVNADSLSTWVLPALASLAGTLCFDLHREDEDHSTALLREGVVMGAITTVAAPVQGCSATRLGRMRYRAMASESFRKKWFPDGITPAALGAAPVVVFDRKDTLQDRYMKRYARKVLSPPRTYVPSSPDYAEAVGHGMGWGLLPELQSKPLRRTDSVVELDPERFIDVALYWQHWKLSSAPLQMVTAALTQKAKAALR